MTKGRKSGMWGMTLGLALGMAILGFLIPVFCFWNAQPPRAEAAKEEGIAVLPPLTVSKRAETLDLDMGTGELDGARTVRVLDCRRQGPPCPEGALQPQPR